MSKSACALAPVSFLFENNPIRVINRKGSIWFVAADVGTVLALTNVRASVALLDDDERGVNTIDTPSGRQEMSIINESGLYALILRSRKPEAKRFRKWVTSEVLPVIRKTGKYSVSQSPAFRLENGQEYIMRVNPDGTATLEPRGNTYESLIKSIADPGNHALKDETIKTIIDVCVSTLLYRLKAEKLRTAETDLLNDPNMKKALSSKGGAK